MLLDSYLDFIKKSIGLDPANKYIYSPYFDSFLILVLFFAVIWWIVKGKFSSESPGEILKKRLASGEITMKEYEKLKREIQ